MKNATASAAGWQTIKFKAGKAKVNLSNPPPRASRNEADKRKTKLQKKARKITKNV